MTNDRVMLEINLPAPAFHLKDIFDREINLKEYHGKKVLVAFFRHAGCPFCNTRVHSLEKKHKELKAKGLEMIFFFESTKELLSSSDFHNSISPIPLIADPEKTIYARYGVENSGVKSAKSHIFSLLPKVVEAKLKGLPVHMMEGNESIKTIPAEFLINERGLVKKIHYAKGLRERMSIDLITEFAETGNVK
ncbi:MAG: peroxiredoxin-like family protein [Ekhidna sp.]